HDVVHVLEAPLIKVPGLVHIEDLAIEVADGREVLSPQGRLDLREYVVEILLEPGAGEKIEHAAIEEERAQLRRRKRDRLPARRRHESPHFALTVRLLAKWLTGSLKCLDVSQGGPRIDLEPLTDVVDGHALLAI